MKKSRAREYRISDGEMIAIHGAVAELLGQTSGGQRRRNLVRQLATVTQALRGRGYLIG